MAWQGIPFPLRIDDVFYHANIALDKIPKIVIENISKKEVSDTIIAAVIGGGIPALVAIVAMFLNARSLKKQMENHERIASDTLKGQLVTAYRKDWVNDLRNATSLYLANMQEAINAFASLDFEKKRRNKNPERIYFFTGKYSDSIREMSTYSWRVKLLLKPEHSESAVVIDHLDEMVKVMNGLKPLTWESYCADLKPLVDCIQSRIKIIIDKEMGRFESLS